MTAGGEIVGWLDERLGEAGRRRIGDVTVPRVRPWGTVMRAETDGGTVWLKLPAPDTAFEVALYPVLHRLAPDRVLAPLAADPVLGRLLLPDGGPTLRDLGQDLAVALPGYALLQRALAPAAGELLALGVADMRPAVLPRRFDEALEVVAGVAELRGLRSWFADVAAALAESPVPASLDHADLHPGNVFAAGGRCYDWGDSVVGHPFGSMLVALRGERDDRSRDAYLEVFTDLAPRSRLLGDLRLARIAGNVIRALTWHRALAADPDRGRGTAFGEAPAVHLRQLAREAPWECP